MLFRIRELRFVLIAISVGVMTGLSATLFNYLILKGTGLLSAGLGHMPIFYLILPLCAALLTSLLYRLKLIDSESGMGVVQVLFEMHSSQNLLMKPIRIFWNTVATLITLLFGMTAGRFGPITHLGAAIGSNIARYFDLDDHHIRLMMGCGAAGAIATVFNLPFFSALFVMEVMFRERYFRVLGPLLISAVISNQVGIYLLGNREPMFVWVGNVTSIQETLVPYMVMGIAAGMISALYILAIEKLGEFSKKFKYRTLKLFSTALIIGIIAFIMPEQFEIHNNTTHQILFGTFSNKILFILIFSRMVMTALTLGAGFIGGNFYPGVTIGAALGVLCYNVFNLFAVKVPSQSEMGALGIGAVLAGFLHAPIACTVLVLEITKNTDILMPAMVVTALAVIASYTLRGRDIFSLALGKMITEYRFKA